jgi:hypothetical protein
VDNLLLPSKFRQNTWKMSMENEQLRKGEYPYPCDAWAVFCPIINFIHFCEWAARNTKYSTLKKLGNI